MKIIIFTLLLSTQSYAAPLYEVSDFPASKDTAVVKCRSVAIEAKQKGSEICQKEGSGSYFVCPLSKEIRKSALDLCGKLFLETADKPAFLYLLGLVHADYRTKANSPKGDCPSYFDFQEGSFLCVYNQEHFQELIKKFPKSPYADLAALKSAKEKYKYYECEGQEFCRVENLVHGFAGFLKNREKSSYFAEVIDQIGNGLDSLDLSNVKIEHESSVGLAQEISTLKETFVRLNESDRDKLEKFILRAEKNIELFQDMKNRAQEEGPLKSQAEKLGCRMVSVSEYSARPRIISTGCMPPYFVTEGSKNGAKSTYIWCHPKEPGSKNYYIQVIDHKNSTLSKGCKSTINLSNGPCTLSIDKNQLFSGSPDEVGEFIYCEKGAWKTRFIH